MKEITIEVLREWSGDPTLADEELQAISNTANSSLLRSGMPTYFFKDMFITEAKRYIRIKNLIKERG